MQFSQNIGGFRQNESQDFQSYNSINKTQALEKISIFTIYQNYTVALTTFMSKLDHLIHVLT